MRRCLVDILETFSKRIVWPCQQGNMNFIQNATKFLSVILWFLGQQIAAKA